MNDFMKQISSYNLFNSLLPGVVFVEVAARILGLQVPRDNLLVGAFVYYFVGLIVSRFGSLVLEPLLRKARFLDFACYSDYVLAAKNDPKIDVLSETNNTYRTMLACLVMLMLLALWDQLSARIAVMSPLGAPLLSVSLVTLFLYAYRKQSAYIKSRVEANGVKE